VDIKINNYKNSIILLSFLCLFLVEFFSYLSELGISGSDTVYYIQAAEKWVRGDYLLTYHYRPLSYLLYSLALSIFGFEFYSIKILNGLVTILSFILLYKLFKKELNKNHSALLSGIFLVLPTTISYAKTELMHALAGLFFISVLLALHNFYTTKDKKWLVATFFLLGLSLNIHRSSVLFFPFIIIITMLILYKLKSINISALTWSFLAFLIPIAIPMYIWGIEEVCQTFLGRYNKVHSQVVTPTDGIWTWLNINIQIVKYVIGNQQWLLYLYPISLTTTIIYGLYTKKYSLIVLNTCLQISIVLWGLFISSAPMSRHFLPYIFIVLLNYYYSFFILTLKIKYRTYLYIILFVALLTSPRIEYYPNILYASTHLAKANLYVFNNFKFDMERLMTNENDKVLFLPLTFSSTRSHLTLQAYLGDKIVYASEEAKYNSFSVSKYKFVAYMKAYTWMKERKSITNKKAKKYYNTEKYSKKVERELINNELNKVNSEIVLNTKFYTIYKIKEETTSSRAF
jgi:4-amino-4-deoxy-L-arabinose transferase-like glycosyltransferase